MTKQEKINKATNYLTNLDLDGEAIEAILNNIGMDKQMLKQLSVKASIEELCTILRERASLEKITPNNFK